MGPHKQVLVCDKLVCHIHHDYNLFYRPRTILTPRFQNMDFEGYSFLDKHKGIFIYLSMDVRNQEPIEHLRC